MTKAVYPGSFDPITNGHTDIINRVSNVVDHLVVAVLENQSKKSLFTVEERIRQIQLVTQDNPKVEVCSFSGLAVDFAASCGAQALIRGLRAMTDFESEFRMALINQELNPNIETMFITTNKEYMFVSSSGVKEIVYFGGNIDTMVHPDIKKQLLVKFGKEG